MIRKAFASLIVLIVLLATVVFSFAYAMFESYLSPDFYKDEAVVEEVYDVVTDLLIEQIESMKEEGEEGLEFLDLDKISDTVRELLPTEYIIEINTSIIDQLSEDPLPAEIVIDLRDLKEKLPAALEDIIKSYIEGIDTCTEEQLLEMQAGLEAGEMLECIPPEIDKEQLIAELGTSNIEEVIEEFPNDYKISLEELTPDVKTIIKLAVNNNATVKAVILGVYLVLLALIALIIFSPIKSILWWVGNTMFWGAMPLALINPTISTSINKILPMLAEQNPDVSVEQIQKGAEMIQSFSGFITNEMFWHGIIFGGIGLVMIIISVALPKYVDEK